MESNKSNKWGSARKKLPTGFTVPRTSSLLLSASHRDQLASTFRSSVTLLLNPLYLAMRVMRCGVIRALGVTAVVGAIMASLLPLAACFPAVAAGSTDEGGGREGMGLRRTTAAVGTVGGEDGGGSQGKPEAEAKLIQPTEPAFKQQPDEWEIKGISLSATGEPTSELPWFGRTIARMCVHLCGNPENTWCKRSEKLISVRAGPRYELEMLHAETGELFLHFKYDSHLGVKHEIPGLNVEGEDCSRGGMGHDNAFTKSYPCEGSGDVTRDSLTACLPDTSPACIQEHLPPLDPAVKRMAVIFRDPRNSVISAHSMSPGSWLGGREAFILKRFEGFVAWIHQRYVWHTTALKDISHIVFYEDLKVNPQPLVDLAAFVGLNCTTEEANDMILRHKYATPRKEYTTYELSIDTMKWMNATMAKILPEAMLDRYGLIPI